MQNTEALIFVFSIRFLIRFIKKPRGLCSSIPLAELCLRPFNNTKTTFNTVGK